MAGDRPGLPEYDFYALNVDFSSSSSEPLGSRRPAHANVKK